MNKLVILGGCILTAATTSAFANPIDLSASTTVNLDIKQASPLQVTVQPKANLNTLMALKAPLFDLNVTASGIDTTGATVSITDAKADRGMLTLTSNNGSSLLASPKNITDDWIGVNFSPFATTGGSSLGNTIPSIEFQLASNSVKAGQYTDNVTVTVMHV